MNTGLESLENRRLFAVNLTNGLLAIEGTDLAETITLTPRASTLSIRMGGERTTVNLDDVDEVLISGLGGNDRVTVGKLNVPVMIDGGAGDDRISGGRADDLLSGGDGNDRIAGGGGDDQLFGAAGDDRLFGDAGNDELSGGDGADLINGGAGSDMSDTSGDIVTGVEDDDDNDDDDDGTQGTGRISNLLRSPFTPLDTTGLVVRPGNDVISPILSSAPGGNAVFFNPFTGVTLQSGGAFVTLSNTGTFGRELGLPSGIPGAALR